MLVYANRVRRAHCSRRARKERFAFVAGFVLVLALIGIAGRDDYQANQKMASEFSRSRRCQIVASSFEGEQVAAEYTAAGHAPFFASGR